MAVLGVVLGLVLQPFSAARAYTPDDPKFDRQWGLEIVGAPEAWEKTLGEGVTIAVVDSGIDLGHEDLRDKISVHISCVDADDDPDACTGSGQDDHGHGTHVAGIAAAATGNGVGVASVAPRATLMAVKVLEPNSAGQATGSLPDIRAGIRWAVDHGADVINLSLGENVLIRGLFGTGMQDAIEYAWEQGAVPVVAAGNTNTLFNSGYGDLPALVVAATTRDDEIASYSTQIGDAEWGIAAPGGETTSDGTGEIFSTFWEEGRANVYGWGAGTSMATPHVSGAVADLLSRGFTPAGAVERLLDTAVDLGKEGRDRDFGHGRLDLAAATADLSPRPGFSGTSTTTTSPPPPPPPPTTTPPTVAAQQVTTSTEPPPTPTTVAPSTTTTTTTSPPPEKTAAVAVPDPPSGDGLGAWGVIGGTALGLAVLGARGVWLRRSAAVDLRRA